MWPNLWVLIVSTPYKHHNEAAGGSSGEYEINEIFLTDNYKEPTSQVVHKKRHLVIRIKR